MEIENAGFAAWQVAGDESNEGAKTQNGIRLASSRPRGESGDCLDQSKM
jgi:hypothetical protein